MFNDTLTGENAAQGTHPFSRAGEGRFRQVVECAPNALVIVNGTGQIEMVNVQTEKLFGYGREELLGQNAEILVPPRHRSANATARGIFLAGPQPLAPGAGPDLFGLRKDGTEFPAEIGLNRIETDAGAMVLSAIVDVSAWKRLEAQLRDAMDVLYQTQKMESLGQTTGGIAHDFGNALTIITGSIVAVQRSGEVTSPRMVRALETASQGAARAAKLTSQLLAFSRRQTLEPEAVNLDALAAGAPEMLAPILGDSVSVFLVTGAAPWWISVDPGRLRDALCNLAANARDAMDGNGSLSIATGKCVLDKQDFAQDKLEPGEFVSIVVRDSGCGMTKEVRDRMFEPFFTTKPAGKGTGLGLSQVYGFVRQSGGCVQVQSAPGQGTEFRLYFARLVHEA